MLMRFSLRVSTHFTGRPSRRASHAAMTNSGYTTAFGPKPPPTAGAITLTWSGGASRAAATWSRTSWGRWVVHHSVTPSSRSPFPGAASTTDGSIGAPDIRWLTNCPFTTTSCPVMVSDSAVVTNSIALLDPWASMITAASGSRASNGSVTAGSGS